MYDFLDKVTKRVALHTTGFGAVWYVVMLGFRVFVVSTVGAGVYGDEQDKFKCSVEAIGCTQQCYDQFARLSHVRFWSFQILFALTPALFFQLYSLFISNQINKIEAIKEAIKKSKEDAAEARLVKVKEMMKFAKRSKQVGKYEMKNVKRVYIGKVDKDKEGEDKAIPHSRNIQIANIIHLFVRLAIEIAGVIIGAHMFNIQNGERGKPLQLSQIFWNSVPGFYNCRYFGTDGVSSACSSNLGLDKRGSVPCFVSRQYEKTILLRYMNLTSLVCIFLTMYEIIAASYRLFRHGRKPRHSVRKPIGLNRCLDSAPTQVYVDPETNEVTSTVLRVEVDPDEVLSIHSGESKRGGLGSRALLGRKRDATGL